MSEQDTPAPSTSASTAVQVIYCGVCSLPPEYCEYGPTLSKCKEWLQEKHSELFDKLYSQTNIENDVATLSLENKPTNDAEDKKKAKVFIEAAKIERELQKKMASKVTITRIARNKKKSVTNVGGLQNFDIDLKKAAKNFASKFACGSSVVKNNQGIDEIVVQGDVSDDLYDYILETWPNVPEDNIELTEEKKSKK
ncbi:density-regulated protein DRP1 [Rhizophagus irregularis]|uniref:Translation machinery-associated protein 22 n=2 Tax=Rhizophagus irregularis TaxID=588596 RepID=A0A2I1GW92_9GLOM|nr:density-regulated protein DRP1 [Rhizophagus irregularis DAOM 181602=DAOM 197198]PKC04032.1 density-regulated protein DRP1 [Rhizophagus irregularis]PKC59888.1 density-regulated protein DRP1 [Rhizophagus irregularis]PKK78468.1 density-regulated protein DRP1 [Rhizophagus irregularis]PKY50794.1 density-regulated protein DRP1 [Rhizophagus irregularis]POG70243.1 density-regulated protein DRP1 [Rhizophagus irregularis DAOM 181602=DAOM 197198]|eukprot:XP_025177109.1 density-regulated protein DRP1 [Rhizophagus irregularis DAOM 181602=DAOM 197198]